MNQLQTRACGVMLLLAIFCGCTGSPEARRDKYLARGKTLLQKHDYSRAILEFRNAAKAMPKDAEAYYQIGVASEDSGDIRTAVAFLKRALDENPKHAGAQLKLAQLMANATDKRWLIDAESRLKALRESSRVTPEVLNTLAFTELKLGKTDNAIQDLEEVLTKAPGELSSSIMLAKAKLLQHDPEGAEKVLKSACEASPQVADPRAILGEFYFSQKRVAEAEEEYRRALAINPKSERGLMDLASLQSSLGQKKKAEENFKRLAGLGENSYKPVYALFLFEEGRRTEAIREFERLAKQDPEDRLARPRLMAAYRAVNRASDAEKMLDEALKKNPKDLDALLQRGGISLSAGQYDQAETDLNRVVHLQPNSAEARYFLAKLYEARGATLTYRQELSEALQLNPYLLAVRLELAHSLIAEQQAGAALDILNAAPASQTHLTSVVVQRNWALGASGDLVEMRKGIDQGLSQGRSAGLRALSALNKSYIALKQPEMALKAIKEYASREPHSAFPQIPESGIYASRPI